MGLDPGTYTLGWALFDAQTDELKVGTFTMPKKLALDERLDMLETWLGNFPAEHGRVDFVAVERQFRNRALLQIWRIARHYANEWGAKSAELSCSTARMRVTGSGDADKEEVRAMLAMSYRLPKDTDTNASDAACIAIAAVEEALAAG